MAEETKADKASKQKATDQPAEGQKKPAPKTAEKAKHADADVKKSDTAKLEKQVADLKDQLAKKDDLYLRAEAEIQNMTNHFKKERADLLKYEGQDLIKEILPVLDNLKRALAIKVEDDQGKQLHDGIQMVHDHLVKALKEHGVTEIEADGKPFDPTVHQAVSTTAVTGDQKPDTVVQVYQAGYKLKDRVLRPAMVVVAQ